ncbi:MAG: DUF3006 domain-containing protein [Methanoregula sp.]|nr:DUF3006 domain-containing protein [Methanoregula sp.]
MKAVIDRIGTNLAVLVIPEEENIRLNLPTDLLPQGCSEGDIVTLTLERDDEGTREAQERAARLISGLVCREQTPAGSRD